MRRSNATIIRQPVLTLVAFSITKQFPHLWSIRSKHDLHSTGHAASTTRQFLETLREDADTVMFPKITQTRISGRHGKRDAAKEVQGCSHAAAG